LRIPICNSNMAAVDGSGDPRRTQALVLEKEPGLTCTPMSGAPESRGHIPYQIAGRDCVSAHHAELSGDTIDQDAAISGLQWARRS